MSINSVYSFLFSPTTYCKTFSRLASVIESAEKNQNCIRENVIVALTSAIPSAMEGLCSKLKAISTADWKKIDHSFSALVSSVQCKRPPLKIISKIESLCKKKLLCLDPKFSPIALIGPENKTAILSASSLSSEMFQNMLKGDFAEAENHEIFLDKLSPVCFDILVAFLKGNPFTICEENLIEIFSLAHLYCLPELFVEALSFLLIDAPQQKKTADANLRATCQLIFSLFGIEQDDSYASVIQSQLKPTSKTWFCQAADPFFSQVKSAQRKTQERFFSLMNMLGIYLEDGWFFKKNTLKAQSIFTLTATLGNAKAQYSLGYRYEEGICFERAYQQAFIWYAKAAKQGFPAAQGKLGHAYKFGLFQVKQDPVKALKWFTQAAKNGHCPSQDELGQTYEYGLLKVKKNYLLAFHWYRKAALSHYPKAQFHLADCYEKGLGIEKNHQTALNWYKKAAIGGDIAAQLQLASFYESSSYIADHTQAINWYLMAAKQANVFALQKLSFLYANGICVDQDLKIARFLAQLAANPSNFSFDQHFNRDRL